MFLWVIRYLGFLKFVPLLPLFFDSWLKVYMVIANPLLLDWMDELESEIQEWEGTSISMHRYGGLQFNYGTNELGHIHSNGCLDILFDQETKHMLLKEKRVIPHHTFTESGWLSFYVRSEKDKAYALSLLLTSYNKNVKAALRSIPDKRICKQWPS